MSWSFDQKKIWARGLLVKCPFDTSLEDCPLREVRKLSVEERMAKVEKMSDEELHAVLLHHWDCQVKRAATV